MRAKIVAVFPAAALAFPFVSGWVFASIKHFDLFRSSAKATVFALAPSHVFVCVLSAILSVFIYIYIYIYPAIYPSKVDTACVSAFLGLYTHDVDLALQSLLTIQLVVGVVCGLPAVGVACPDISP